MNAKHLMTGAIVGALALAGCMSLEERLASSDASVRRNAEYELVRQSYKNGSQKDRLAAIERVTDQELLFALAKQAKDSTAKEGAAAVAKVTDNARVLQVATESAVAEVGNAALAKVTDVAAYENLARNAKTASVRQTAYEKISDQQKLLAIALATKDKAVKLSAIKRVADKEKLLPIVFASVAVRPTVPVIKHNPDAEKKMMAEKVSLGKKMAKEKMAVDKGKGGKSASTHVIESSALDAELVNAFIENCSDDSAFIKVVKNYGGDLQKCQCDAIKAKAKSEELLSLLNSVSDLKIVKRIRNASPDEYSELLDAIQNEKIRSDAAAEQITKILKICAEGLNSYERAGKYGVSLSYLSANFRMDNPVCAKLINSLSAEEVESGIMQNSLRGEVMPSDLFQLLLGRLTDEEKADYLGRMFKMMPDVGTEWEKWNKEQRRIYYLCKSIMDGMSDSLTTSRMTSNQTALKKLIKAVEGRSVKEEFLYSLMRKISAPEVADLFIDTLISFRPSDNNDYVNELRGLITKISVGRKQEIVARAEARVKNLKNDEFAFGPFCMGMPCVEAYLLAEKLGIRDQVAFSCGEKVSPKDWKTAWKVDNMTFTGKAKFKFLDCEDANVLPQTIRQYVKKQSGRAEAFDYASEIKHDLDISTSRSLDAFSPTGTRLNVDSEIWNVYTNSKMGVRIQYGEKKGVLLITALED